MGEEEKEYLSARDYVQGKYPFDRDHSVRIRIFDFNDNEAIGSWSVDETPEEREHSVDKHYEDWLENASIAIENIGSDPKYKYILKHIEPHPKNKDMLIHYYEAVEPHLTMYDIVEASWKLGRYLLGVAVFVWLITIIPWKIIFGFIFLMIQGLFN